MPCAKPEYDGPGTENLSWENFLKTFAYNVPGFFQPRSYLELSSLLQEAASRKVKVKAVGSGWSASRIAQTPKWLIDIGALNERLNYLIGSSKVSRALTDRKDQLHQKGYERLIHVEAGITLFDLNQMLDGLGLAINNYGFGSGETLAGAISTSKNGGDINCRPLAGHVRAIHLISDAGKEFWIESKSDPLTDNDDVLRLTLPCKYVEIIRDDNLFHATTVGLGRFGVVYSYVLQTDPAYRLIEWTQELQWDDLAAKLREGVFQTHHTSLINQLLDAPAPALQAEIPEDSKDYHYFNIVLNPLKKGKCWVIRRWKTENLENINLHRIDQSCDPGAAAYVLGVTAAYLSSYAIWLGSTNPFEFEKAVEVGNRATELTSKALDADGMTSGEAMAVALNTIWEVQVDDDLASWPGDIMETGMIGWLAKSMQEGVRGKSWQVGAGINHDPFNPNCFTGTALEVVFQTTDTSYIDFIEFLLENSKKFRYFGYIAIRFTRPCQALLAMQNFDEPLVVSIAITSLKGLPDTESWLDFLERRALKMGGRPHWGLRNRLTATRIKSLYGNDFEKWRDQLTRVSGGSMKFSNAYTKKRGLEPGEPKPVNEIEITAVRQSDGAITDLASPDVFPGPIPIEVAIQEIDANTSRYFIFDENKKKQYLSVRRYLTTASDKTQENNLLSLPNKPSGKNYPLQPPLTRNQKVTFIIKKGKKSGSSYQAISHIGNHEEQWVTPLPEAFELARKGVYQYYTQVGKKGKKKFLETREYLISARNSTKADNLDNLPTF